jgi:hypothetical protein
MRYICNTFSRKFALRNDCLREKNFAVRNMFTEMSVDEKVSFKRNFHFCAKSKLPYSGSFAQIHIANFRGSPTK